MAASCSPVEQWQRSYVSWTGLEQFVVIDFMPRNAGVLLSGVLLYCCCTAVRTRLSQQTKFEPYTQLAYQDLNEG